MNSEDIRRVIALMDRHGIDGFDYEQGSIRLRLTLGPGLEATAAVDNPGAILTDEPEFIRSPGVGIVLHAHPATAKAPSPLPRNAAKGEIVAYIRTGLTLRAVTATRDCVLAQAVVAGGHAVGYGEALFETAP